MKWMPLSKKTLDIVPPAMVSVAVCVREVVPQMHAPGGHDLAVWQHAHVLPVHLAIAKARPAVGTALSLKL